MNRFLGQSTVAVLGLVLIGATAGHGALQKATATVRPPMHRAWTYVTGERTEVLAVRNGIIYFTSQQRTGAISLSDGKVIWEKKRPDWTMNSVIDDKRIIVSTSSMEKGRMIAYDIRDGKERVIRELPEGAESFALWKNQLCLLLPDRKVTAFDADTGKSAWEVTVGDGKTQRGVSLDELYFCNGVLVLALEDIGWQCVDPANGKTLWKKGAEYATNGAPSEVGKNILLDAPEVALVEPRTGKEVWSRPDLDLEVFGVGAGVLVGETDDEIVGVDIRNGQTLWTLPGGSEGFTMGGGDHSWIGDDDGVIAWPEKFLRISPKGEEVWSSAAFFDGWPAFLNDRAMVTSDGDRILCYVSGEYPRVPEKEEERRAFGERGIAALELLDHTETEQIRALGKLAAEPLIRRYVELAKAQQASYDAEDIGDELGMLRYSLLQTTAGMLSEMCGPEQSAALNKAIEELGPKNSYRNQLVAILGEKGNPDDFIEKYISELRASRSTDERDRNTWQMLDAVSKSKHPSAVAFMIAALKDPTAPDDWRHEAFVHLAGTGGEAGVAAVREARAKRGPRPPWEERIKFSEIEEDEVVSEKSDAAGRTWRLFHSGVLGSHGDLFIAEKRSGGWDKPVFVGVYTRDTWSEKAPTEFRGVAIKEFLESAWVKLLPDDAAIRKDADGDGLTDLAEKRLGTNVSDADTDHDGLGDAVDPCPNAAPRELGDKEKIIAACVEARFFCQDWETPAVIDVEGLAPFEMYGYQQPLLWSVKGYSGELPRMYNTGMNSIGFSSAAREEGPPIAIGADGTSATTLISRYSGGLNGDGIVAKLIKVGDEWFVVSLKMAYVS